MRLLAAVLLLTACGGDETVTAHGGAGVWRLVSLDGGDYAARALLDLRTAGEIAGEGPCNGFGATQGAPYPWFGAGPIRATRRACPDLAAETAFFDALGRMTLAEVSGETLILSTPGGGEMVFSRTEPPG